LYFFLSVPTNYGSLDRSGRIVQEGSEGRSAGSDRDTSSTSGTLERQPHTTDQTRKTNGVLNPLGKLRKMFNGLASSKDGSKQNNSGTDDRRDSSSTLNGGRQFDGDRIDYRLGLHGMEEVLFCDISGVGCNIWES
jgi:hypothetical protein